MSHQQETVRLTVDFPAEQHTYLKMLAAVEGISLQQFIIENLPNLHKEKNKHNDINKNKFDKLLKEFLVKKAPMLKRLAKK